MLHVSGTNESFADVGNGFVLEGMFDNFVAVLLTILFGTFAFKEFDGFRSVRVVLFS
jgi:hypothetical protein